MPKQIVCLALLWCAAGCMRADTILMGRDPGSFSVSGGFAHDDSEADLTFSLSAPGFLAVQTSSWGSSLDGFAPELTLYYGDGVWTGVSAGGNSNVQLDVPLGAGDWLLVLTEYPNLPLGNYADGFQFSPSNVSNPCPGIDNFTGSACLGYGPDDNAFYDSSNIEHTGNWVLAGEVAVGPEPSPIAFVLSGLVALQFGRVAAKSRRAGKHS